MALAQAAGYRIQPGDVLAVTVLEDDTLNRQVLVLPDGRISVPLAGSSQAAGQTVETVERTDRRPARLELRGAPERLRLGGRASPRRSTRPSRSTCSAGSASPGCARSRSAPRSCRRSRSPAASTAFAATKRIQLRRMDTATGQEQLYVFNYNAVERGGAIQSMITLREGDVLLVPERRLFE